MAYNNWDKLCKAQRDFPKPKFANVVIEKALKKQSKNPFLLAWKAEVLLSFDKPQQALVACLLCANAITGATDTHLLAYFYTLCAETLRKTNLEPDGISSVGKEFLKTWQMVAKAAERKSDRLRIWDTLFTIASREDCWDDVLFAVVNYQKEGLADKKQIHYIRILVTHLAAEQKRDRMHKDDQMTQIQFKVARGQMKQAFLASPDEPIAVKDIRDLRFMAEIYARQGQCSELIELWKTAPQSLELVMRTYHDELMNLIARILRTEENWKLLETHCLGIIEGAVAHMKETHEIKQVAELCASRWDIWDNLLQATMNLYPLAEARGKINRVVETCALAYQSNDRPIQRASMILFLAIGADMLPICKQYWECHSATPSCFSDLRSSIEPANTGQQQEFLQFIEAQTMSAYAKEDLDEAKYLQWQQAELNVLKFDYLFNIAIHSSPTLAAIEKLAVKAIKFCVANPEASEGAFVAIYSLLQLHYKISDIEEDISAFEVAPSTRILLQATILARHLATHDSKRENRTLSLLAARLHLNLGLGKSAFQLYNQSKLKEMLLDTLSLYVLSRISMTHPFEVKGYQGFSADEELAKVIGTIERMERKTDTFLYMDLPSFVYDQFPDALSLKRQLKSSLTRQLCITERRRIARLKGQSTEDIPRLSHGAFNHISDNLERSAFPHYGRIHYNDMCSLVMPNHAPNEPWMIKQAIQVEVACKAIYQEVGLSDDVRWTKKYLENTPRVDRAPTILSSERIVQNIWAYLGRYARVAIEDCATPADGTHLVFQADLEAIRKGMQSLILPETTTMKPEDEPTMFSENMLLACYTKLEVIRATNTYLDILRAKVLPAKSTHKLKNMLPKNYLFSVTSEVELCFKAIQDVAQSYITVIRKRGLAAIKAQVRSGVTGEQLCRLLSLEDIQYYASEYVESAIEGWSGIMKVKLR